MGELEHLIPKLYRDTRKMQDAADFLANSWWRRTIINLVGGGDRGIRIEKPGSEPPVS